MPPRALCALCQKSSYPSQLSIWKQSSAGLIALARRASRRSSPCWKVSRRRESCANENSQPLSWHGRQLSASSWRERPAVCARTSDHVALPADRWLASYVRTVPNASRHAKGDSLPDVPAEVVFPHGLRGRPVSLARTEQLPIYADR